MTDGISAVQDRLIPGRSGASGAAGVRIAEIRPFTLVQFAAWPDTLAQTAGEAAMAAGAKVAPGPGRTATGSLGVLLRVEPLKWWFVGDAGEVPLPVAGSGAVLDLSQSRTRLHFSGPQAARLLNHVLPLDLSAAAFPEGSVASTAFHHVGVTLWRDREGFTLFLPRSFAASLCEILTESAVQYRLKIA